MKVCLEFGGEAEKTLERLSKHLGTSPTATIYHALNVLHKAVCPPASLTAGVPEDPMPAARPALDDVDQALSIADEINSLIDQVPEAGLDFAVSVEERTADIAKTIEERGRVTEKQTAALGNMLDGLRRWCHD